jgi:hypothetical protein
MRQLPVAGMTICKPAGVCCSRARPIVGGIANTEEPPVEDRTYSLAEKCSEGMERK